MSSGVAWSFQLTCAFHKRKPGTLPTPASAVSASVLAPLLRAADVDGQGARSVPHSDCVDLARVKGQIEARGSPDIRITRVKLYFANTLAPASEPAWAKL